MKIDISSIQNPQIRVFYSLWWPQHQILLDFTGYLTEEQLDYRMVDSSSRKADTPRESLAHILYVQLVYLNAVKTGKLEFKDMGVAHYKALTKVRLLTEWECIDQEMFTYLTADTFDSQGQVEVPWGGKMNAVDLLFFLRDHDILHTDGIWQSWITCICLGSSLWFDIGAHELWSNSQKPPNTACTRLVGVGAFSSGLRSSKLVLSKWRYLVPPTSG